MDLLGALTDGDIKQLARLCQVSVVGRGTRIYGYGEPPDHVYVLESGAVRLSRSAEDGREVNIAVLGPTEVFGESALSPEGGRSDTATALEDTVVCAFESRPFDRFLRIHPALALRVTKLIGERLQRVEDRIQDILFKDVRTRLAHTIAGLAQKFGEEAPQGTRIRMRLTQTDLAQLIGSTRETTSTIFNEFRRGGLVGSDGPYIIVLDVDTLGAY